MASSEKLPNIGRDALREVTRPAHAMVDDAFSRFDLTDPASYRAFLIAHARIVPVVEAWLDRHQPADMAGWATVRRTPGLLADLATLGETPPPTIDFAPSGDIASVCGITYVLEGSRLGSSLLSRRVAAGLPVAYLAAPAQSALWRGFLAGLDRHLPTGAARERAGQAALHMFDCFRAAAGQKPAML